MICVLLGDEFEKYYDYQITRTSRGRPKIIAVGYGYIQKAKDNFRNWVCDKRRETKCLVTSTLQDDNGLVITPKHRHTHGPNHMQTKIPDPWITGNGFGNRHTQIMDVSPFPVNLSQVQVNLLR